MDGKLKSQLFERISVGPDEIHQILKTFSVYLDEFNKDYKYNYKFIVSHIEDFEKALKVHGKYLNKCLTILNKIKEHKLLKNEFQKFAMSKGKVSFELFFDNVLYCDITNIDDDDDDPFKIIGSVKPEKWTDIIQNDNFDIEVSIKLIFENIVLTRRFYKNDRFQINEQLLIVKFFEDAYKTIINEKIGVERFKNIVFLNGILKEKDLIKIVVDDNMSVCYSKRFDSDLLKTNSISFDTTESEDTGKVFISTSKKQYKFDIANLDDIELMKKTIEDELLQGEKI